MNYKLERRHSTHTRTHKMIRATPPPLAAATIMKSIKSGCSALQPLHATCIHVRTVCDHSVHSAFSVFMNGSFLSHLYLLFWVLFFVSFFFALNFLLCGCYEYRPPVEEQNFRMPLFTWLVSVCARMYMCIFFYSTSVLCTSESEL